MVFLILEQILADQQEDDQNEILIGSNITR
jgi:hypothetical protein